MISADPCPPRGSLTGTYPGQQEETLLGTSQNVVMSSTLAWAGNTPARSAGTPSLPAHPRVGGEYGDAVVSVDAHPGSSPRGRGIPVCRAGRPSRRAAHPRVGGEYGVGRGATRPGCGSSPRERGILNCVACGACVTGLIPAWAGNTYSGRSRRNSTAAHPRVGGEYRVVFRRPPTIEGLIPAWAGNTTRPAERHARGSAHPRVGGEYLSSTAAESRSTGSSPRGRGIPAPRARHSRQGGAHPRVGGEYEPGHNPG